MKKHLLLFLVAFFFLSFSYSQNDAQSNQFNYTSFTNQQAKITPELESLTSSEFKSHPEYGVLPYNAPCKDCIELLQKRDETHRYFVKEGSKGKEFYAQSSYGDESFRDETGVLRTIDPCVTPANTAGVFKAAYQPFPVSINIPGKFTSILNAGKELQVNRNSDIYIKHADGTVSSLGQSSWSDYTAGDNGLMIHNYYPGIDLELRSGRGRIESFYHINKPLQLTDGWLVISDHVKLPDGFVYDYSYSEKKEDGTYAGALCINDAKGMRYFVIGNPSAYDINNEQDHLLGLQYEISANSSYDLYMPVSWMNDAKRVYPIIIDPVVMATSILPQAMITGSKYDPVCFQNGCMYQLPVVVPPGCTVTDIRYSFNYRALGQCNLNQGAWDLSYGACKSPINTCRIGLPGLCILQNLSCFVTFGPCVPPPQCATYNMDFTLDFYRCVQPGAACTFSCINADTPWDMTVIGNTIEVTTSNATVCEGSSVNLTANATWGVPPITYTWNPGALSGQTVTVSPVANTVYTVTASDCGGQDQAQAVANVTVIQNDNPGFTINPNPACVNGPVTITGLGAATDPNYSWTLNGANNVTVTGQKSFTDSYANNGVYDITLHYNDGTCIFDNTQQITFLPPITTVATGNISICPGQSTQLNATAQGGDGGPFNFTWSSGDQGTPITVTPAQTTVYTAIASDACGTSIPSNPVTVTVLPPPPADFTFNPSDPSEFALNVQFVDRSVGAVTWQWNFGDGSPVDATENPMHKFPGIGTYTITLTITDANGCTNTISYTLEVHEEYFFYIPNAFTPNGDGLNDYFAPQGTDGLIYEMTIYNRWGERIFETSNSSLPWSGEVAGSNKIAPAGVYVYRVKFQNSAYTSKEIVGNVTLVR